MKSTARYYSLEMAEERGDWRSVNYKIVPNAMYAFTENQMIIPYQSLDGWWFDAERPEPLNIATLSLGVFHEITHGFDSLGGQYDNAGWFI